MRKNIRVGVDVCSTLMNWLDQLERIYRREYPDKWIDFPPDQYDISKSVEIGSTVFDRAYNGWAPELYLGADPFSSAAKFMQRLYDYAFPRCIEVYVISYQPNIKTKSMIKRWLDENDIVRNKTVFAKGKNKHKYVDILFDDCPDVLETARQNGTKAVAWEHEYNKDFSGEVVSNYDDSLEIVKEYCK